VTALLALLLLAPVAHAEETKGDVEYVVVESPFHADETACVVDQDGAACFRAGMGWYSGQGIDKPSKMQAENLFRAGCSFQDVDSCLAAGNMFLKMEAGMLLLMPKGTVSLDMGQAAYFFRAACDLGSLPACGVRGDLLTNPASMLPDPSAVARNLDADLLAARQSYSDGCNEGLELNRLPLPEDDGLTGVDLRSCVRLSELHQAGIGVRKDLKAAAYFLERACWTAGGERYCDAADELAEQAAAIEPSDGKEKPLELDGEGKSDGRKTPSARRFESEETGILSLEKGDKPHRFSIETAWGARWTYAHPQLTPPIAGVKIRVGLTAWFGLLGISLDLGILTDRPFNEELRRYGRVHGSLGPKIALPVPSVLPIPSATWFELGAGGTLGALKLNDDEWGPNYGIRQMVQFVLSSPQDRGPRQWGALRWEQQQDWWPGATGPMHSSQVVVVFGATFGGWGPRWKKLQGAK